MILRWPHGLRQTNAFEIEGRVIQAIYVGTRNPDKLKHLT